MLARTSPTAPLLIWGTAGTDTGVGTAAEAVVLIADGIIDADGLTFRAEDSPRTCRITYHRDFHPGSDLHWRVYTYGPGHWCLGTGHSGSFRSPAEAVTAGADWIETGRDRSGRRAA